MTATRDLLPEIGPIRALLGEQLPFPPFDFVRAIAAAGDRSILLDRLAAPVGRAEDLGFVMTLPGEGDVAVFAEALPWDTAFFGYGVGRLNGVFPLAPPLDRPAADYRPALAQLLERARRHDIRYLVAYVDPRDLALLRALGQLGFVLIETRAYYHMDIRGFRTAERFAVRPAVAADVPALARAAAEAVNPYDRFHSDPFVDPADAARLMRRWVEASILGDFADVTIVPDVPDPAAFSTVRYHRDKWDRWELRLAQSAVLTAVAPSFRGWYRKIASEVNHHLLDQGAEHVYLGTQVTNKAVIWVLEGLGYQFGKSELIFRFVL